MKFSDKFKVRSVAGENVIIMQGRHGSDMTKIISLNETSLFLWNHFTAKDFEVSDVAQALLDEYEVEPAIAQKDAQDWCDKLKECGLIESEK